MARDVEVENALGIVGTDSLTVDERCCRGDWDAPKSEASNATIGVEPCVIERINRLKQLTVDVKAGRAVRHYRVVKSDRPEDLVFQSVRTGAPMRDNNILSRHIKPAARKLGLPWINWRCLRTSHATWGPVTGARGIPRRGRRKKASTMEEVSSRIAQRDFTERFERIELTSRQPNVRTRTARILPDDATAASRTPLWLASGGGCRGRRLSRA